MEIASAKPEDVNSILQLQKQIYRVSTLAPNGREVLENQLKDPSCVVLVAKIDGKIIGAGTIYLIQVPARGKPYAFLEGLVIDSSLRGKGYGTQLFQGCVKIARQKGCYKMLFTSGMDRADAHKFYEKLGFKKWGFEFRMDLD